MEELTKFKAMPRKTGGSFVVTIPSDFIEHGLIDPDQEYEFKVHEVSDE